jgi:hypothetical protein
MRLALALLHDLTEFADFESGLRPEREFRDGAP